MSEDQQMYSLEEEDCSQLFITQESNNEINQNEVEDGDLMDISCSVGTAKTVSNIRKFNRVSDARMRELQTKTMKRHSYNKMLWSVRAYNDWRMNRFTDIDNFDNKIFNANLENLKELSRDDFEYAMCRFIAEVRKLKSGKDYPGKILYQMSFSIQKYLNQNGINWKFVDGPDFGEFRVLLDNLMEDRARHNIGMSKSKPS